MNRYLILSVIALAVVIGAILSAGKISRLEVENARYRGNTETLLSDIERYRVQDSLSAARVKSLELTISEYERFRSDDAALIRSLKAKNRDLAAVNKTLSEMIIDLRAIPKDTVIIRDSVPVKAVSVYCGDAWFDFYGLLTDVDFTGKLESRDSLVLAETVKYKRFLGFLWKTRNIEDRQLDVVSKNPHNTIVGLEHITIEK